jgi:hypothetical protein
MPGQRYFRAEVGKAVIEEGVELGSTGQPGAAVPA